MIVPCLGTFVSTTRPGRFSGTVDFIRTINDRVRRGPFARRFHDNYNILIPYVSDLVFDNNKRGDLPRIFHPSGSWRQSERIERRMGPSPRARWTEKVYPMSRPARIGYESGAGPFRNVNAFRNRVGRLENSRERDCGLRADRWSRVRLRPTSRGGRTRDNRRGDFAAKGPLRLSRLVSLPGRLDGRGLAALEPKFKADHPGLLDVRDVARHLGVDRCRALSCPGVHHPGRKPGPPLQLGTPL